MKSNYHIKSKKTHYELSYNGDLEEALQKAKSDLEKAKESKEVLHWEWIKKKADTALKTHYSKIEGLKAFIRAAERQIENETTEKEKTQKEE